MDKETIDALKGLSELRDSGALSQEEFEEQKAALLGKAKKQEEKQEQQTREAEELDAPDQDALTKSLNVVDYRKIIEDWRNERVAERKKFLNRFIRKVKVQEISVTRRIPRKNKYGEQVDIGELISRVCEVYREAGFLVEEGDQHVRIRYKGTVESEVGVNMATIACIVFVKRPATWQVVVRGEMDYWTSKFDRFFAAAFLVILFAIVFWPCLFCIPSLFEVNEDQMKQTAEEHLLAPLVKMLDDFKVMEL